MMPGSKAWADAQKNKLKNKEEKKASKKPKINLKKRLSDFKGEYKEEYVPHKRPWFNPARRIKSAVRRKNTKQWYHDGWFIDGSFFMKTDKKPKGFYDHSFKTPIIKDLLEKFQKDINTGEEIKSKKVFYKGDSDKTDVENFPYLVLNDKHFYDTALIDNITTKHPDAEMYLGGKAGDHRALLFADKDGQLIGVLANIVISDEFYQAYKNSKEQVIIGDKKQEQAATDDKKQELKTDPIGYVGNRIKEVFKSGDKLTSKQLFDITDTAFGGTQGKGTYNVKQAYDAMEYGFNKFILENGDKFKMNPAKALEVVRELKRLTNLLPTQTKRTKEQEDFQQFSTPPALAYIVNLAADLWANDVVLEPSAGTGGLAVFAKAAGVKKVYVNELSDSRMKYLKKLEFDDYFSEDAIQLDNILPDSIKPTRVIMNPPFSATGGRLKQSNSLYSAKHVESALERLENNGRLVAIVGRGMSMSSPTFKKWWSDILKEYTVRANIEVSGKEYAKYGTTFDNRVLVIDKIGQTKDKPKLGSAKNFEELVELLSAVPKSKHTTTSITKKEVSNVRKKEISGDTTSEQKIQDEQVSRKSVTQDKEANKDRPTAYNESARADDTKPRDTNKRYTRRGDIQTAKSESWEDVPRAKDKRTLGDSKSDTKGVSTGDVKSNRDVGRGSSSRLQESADKRVEPRGTDGEIQIPSTVKKKKSSKKLTEAVFDEYIPSVKIKGSKKHITPLVESSAMASVEAPNVEYKPNIPQLSITSGKLTDAQLEVIVKTGASHNQILPSGERKGYYIGDGTGVGKGREIAGIIWDNWNNGRKKAIWVSEKIGLLKDARRDLAGIGWNDGANILFSLNKTKQGNKVIQKQGIMFVPYSTMASNFGKIRQDTAKTLEDLTVRLNQIVKWAGKDYDGVIAFDESHNLGNIVPNKRGRGKVEPSKKALAGVLLQKLLPKARVVYVSATGATEVRNLGYAPRLGLWGEKTPFNNVADFISKISSNGVSAMELVARDMKSMGLYSARSLSYADVKYERLEHTLSKEQAEIYDTLATAWQTILSDINKSVEETGIKRRSALSQLWGAHQRFFNQVITSMQMPSVVKSIQKDIDKGHAVVVQLVSTNSAQLDRRLSSLDKDADIEDIDMTPRETMMRYLEKSFPVQQYEEYTNEYGVTATRPVFDSKGNPVINKKALELKNNLIEKLSDISIPDTSLDMIVQHFGQDAVAEITGRSKRIVFNKKGRKIIEKRSHMKTEADISAFMDDKKKILIFSEKGGTGSSYHADMSRKNQRLRRHYLVQPGWIASKAVQGLGRSHRSFQKQAPEFILVTTDLPGQKRFLSSIARRLDQLGALTKGDRGAGGQGIFSAKDNLESDVAKEGLVRFAKNLKANKYDKLSQEKFKKQTGITEDEFTIQTFLNRLLNMTREMQLYTFEMFSKEIDNAIEIRKQLGTLDIGLQTLHADSIKIKDRKTIYEENKIKTEYIKLDVTNKVEYSEFSDNFDHYVNKKSKSISKVITIAEKTNPTTGIIEKYATISNIKNNISRIPLDHLNKRWDRVSNQEAFEKWESSIAKAPESKTEAMHVLSGTLLPIWDKIGTSSSVVRFKTDEGDVFIGRKILKSDISSVLRNFNIDIKTGKKKEFKHDGEDIYRAISIDNSLVKLDNGSSLKRSLVAGDQRVELINTKLDRKTLEKYGLYDEKIQWRTRWFVPTDVDKRESVIDNIAVGKVIDIIPAVEGAGLTELTKEEASKIYGKGIEEKKAFEISPLLVANKKSYQIGDDKKSKNIDDNEKEVFSSKLGEIKGLKKDLSIIEHVLGTTMYNAKNHGGAYERLYNLFRKSADYKKEKQDEFRQENNESIFEPLTYLKKNSKLEYKKLQNYLIKRDRDAIGHTVFFSEKEKIYIARDDEGKKIGTAKNEHKAWEIAWINEISKSNFSDAGKMALLGFRKMTRNLYKHYSKSMKEMIELTKRVGLPMPKVQIKDNKGKIIKVSLTDAMKLMGDRQGYYFPRLRDQGRYKVEGTKKNENTILKFFNTQREARKFEKQLIQDGYTPLLADVGRFSEDLYQQLSPLLAQEQIITKALSSANIDKTMQDNNDFEKKFIESFANQYETQLKSHGSRARMLGRSGATGIDVKVGYEEDPVIAIAKATEAAAGGYAKQQVAMNGFNIITGRDVTFKEFRVDNKNANYSDYIEFVKNRRIDASKEKLRYKEATNALKDMLKNKEFTDQVIAKLKSLAVFKYLGGRVSSALVNTTNMVMGVPAAIKGEVGVSLSKALSNVGRAMKEYGAYRFGKKSNPVFEYIEKKGWDVPQFNTEALESIRSASSNAMDWTINKSMYLFGVTEKINRATTISSAYYSICNKNKVPEVDANNNVNTEYMEQALNVSNHAHGDYTKANRPDILRGNNIGARALQVGYVFHTFSHNYLQEIARLGLKKKEYGAALYMAMSGGIVGGLGAAIPISLMKTISSLFDYDDPEEWILNNISKNDGVQDVLKYGLAGLVGLNLKGSLQVDFNVDDNLVDLLGAPASMIQDIYHGTTNLTKGYWREGLEKIAPSSIGNISKAFREHKEGVTTRSGSPVFFGNKQIKGDEVDTLIRLLSFSPVKIAKKKDKLFSEYKIKSKFGKHKKEIYKRLKLYYNTPKNERDKRDLANITSDMHSLNKEIKNKGYTRFVSLFTKKSIKSALRSFKPRLSERMRDK